eukprot:CAMPEP_0170621566 /NCGR_PEP_ID=MMETSP0224-20130122/28667_1 /TAXON_ID=285029 /ORGANISM="Togula jolla, Strain CCCM 725" /LENGTH=50 /DNA_ID=CAMNT_0010947829 /DNA_START=299 /DNA_END=451 /DNA_ORIENTATION=+
MTATAHVLCILRPSRCLLSSQAKLAGHFGNRKLVSSTAAAQATHVAAKAG